MLSVFDSFEDNAALACLTAQSRNLVLISLEIPVGRPAEQPPAALPVPIQDRLPLRARNHLRLGEEPRTRRVRRLCSSARYELTS